MSTELQKKLHQTLRENYLLLEEIKRHKARDEASTQEKVDELKNQDRHATNWSEAFNKAQVRISQALADPDRTNAWQLPPDKLTSMKNELYDAESIYAEVMPEYEYEMNKLKREALSIIADRLAKKYGVITQIAEAIESDDIDFYTRLGIDRI